MSTEDNVVDVSQDWVLACDVQQRFMHWPSRKASSVDFCGRCRQLRALGGDCYYCTPLSEDRLAVVVGDASGKGLAAALMIASVQSSLRTAALFTGDDLATLLTTVNHEAYASSLDDRYATVFYGVFDRTTRALRYVNAGHNPPAVLRNDGPIQWLEPSGPPVGMFHDSIYQESLIQLHPGDLVIAYTDGVVEATDAAGSEWGVEGLLNAAAIRQPHSVINAGTIVQQIFNSMDEFSSGHQTDDATVAVVYVA